MKNLNKLYWIKKEIRTIEEQIKELTILSSVQISDMPKGGSNTTSSVERFTEKLLSLKGKLEAKRLEYIEERIKMEDFLATIEDSEISLIARMRFIDNRRWEYIGKEMNMDRTTVSKKLSKYLKYHNAD